MTHVQHNPGSPEAVAQGCTCAVIDNHHGKGEPMDSTGRNHRWYVSGGCPVHDPDSTMGVAAHSPSK